MSDAVDPGERLADVRREAERVQMELRELTHQPHHEHAAPHDEIAGRLEHMRIAVEHLNHAGLHDVAEHVAQRAAAAERELHEHQSHRGQDVMHEIMQQLDELRHEVGQLRNAVNELKRKP
jgi:methyl-accepting chemotaxis protein